jgi:hypothetical protein
MGDHYFTFTSSPKRKAISSCWQAVDGTVPAFGSLNATSERKISSKTDVSRETKGLTK